MKKKYCSVLVVSLFLFSQQGFAQPLKNALLANDTLSFIRLLTSGENISAYDSLTHTDLLIAACRYEDAPEKIDFLLRHGAKPDKNVSAQGRTALHVACAYYGCLNSIKLLVNYGSNVNSVAKDGSTPIMLAALNAKFDVVAYLLSHGAQPAIKDLNGKTVIDYAQKSNDEAEVKRWIKCPIDKAGTIKALQY